MVKRSSRPCVGCAWRPSPALMTCSCSFTWRAMRNGAPEALWRTTKMSACIAERFATVSSSDSPLEVDDTDTLRLMTSAERRLAAISKVVRVRVEDSKNRLNTLLPRRIGTFFTSRSVTPAKDSAVSRICTRISRGSPSMDSKCCSSPFSLSCGLRSMLRLQHEGETGVLALQGQPLSLRHLHLCAAMLRADGQLPLAAIREHDERDTRRPSVVEELVHRRAYRAPAEEHVVDEQDLRAVHVERDHRALGIVLEPARRVVVPIKRDVHQAQGTLEIEHRVKALSEPSAAGVEAYHRRLVADERSQLARQLLAQLLGVRKLRHWFLRSIARG